MYKATRDFLAARQSHTEFKLQTPNVKRIGGGELGKCFENAMAVVNRGKEEGIKYVALSGWLVQPYDKENNCTAIIQHWWNGDSSGNQFDTSPSVNYSEEYVLDFGLYDFIRANYERIKSNVAMSLLYQNGNYELLVDPEKMGFKPVSELRTEYLFRYEEDSN